jgi:RNA polymerase sigma-70 factor (ECF subfamily)
VRHSNIENLQITEDEHSTEHLELLDCMDRALAQLSEDERAIIEMYYYQKLKTKQIAEQTGLSESNVLVRLYRIRAKLKTLINNERD